MKKQSQKEYIVIGLGRFGCSIALQLEANGCKVLAIDRNEQRVRLIADYVTLAMCLDVANDEALDELGGRNFDGAVISIGHSLDASVLATIWAKEQGIGQVIAKAYDEKQGKILTKIGADKIVYPEKEIGISAVRGGTIVGDHDVIFAGPDEVITFSHRAYSKAVFGKGAIQAAKFLAGRPAGKYDMGDVIDAAE